MTDILLPTWLNHARIRIRYIDNTAISRGLYTRTALTTALGGDGIAASIEFTPTGGGSSTQQMERAALISFLMRLRGRQNRAYLWDPSNRRRGSFPTGELLTNNTFDAGTASWTNNGTAASLSVADRSMRVMHTANVANLQMRQNDIAVTQYAPIIARAIAYVGNGIAANETYVYVDDNGLSNATSVAQTMGVSAFVPLSSASDFAVYRNGSVGMAGDFFDVPYTSLSRGALADSGPNLLLQSDTLASTWSPTQASINSNAALSPYGTTDADTIVENTANSQHYLSQSQSRSSVATDLCGYGYFQRAVGTRNITLVIGNDSSNCGTATFDLGAGTISVAASALGAASNARAFIKSAGGGWYFCCVVVRCPAATTIALFAELTSGSSTSYTGDGSSGVHGWRLGAAPSSTPTLGSQTTSAGTSGSNQTGNALYVKGLPASTSGLLLPGDQVEVITSRGSELKFVTASLDSDAAGLGYLQFAPPLRGDVSDNAAIIVHEPMGRFIFAGEFPEWLNEPGIITSASAEFEEA